MTHAAIVELAFVDVILFKLSVKCGEADAQKFGGLGLIAFGITQYFFYMIDLSFLNL